jgi:ketosteroid isomerase-like protein
VNADHPQAQRLRAIYEARGRGEVEPLVEACADGVVWHIPGMNVISGDHAGPAGVEEILRKLQRFPEGVFRVEYERIVADDAYGLVVGNCAVARPGAPVYAWQSFDVLRLADGRIEELWTFASPQEGADAGFACPTRASA